MRYVKIPTMTGTKYGIVDFATANNVYVNLSDGEHTSYGSDRVIYITQEEYEKETADDSPEAA